MSSVPGRQRAAEEAIEWLTPVEGTLLPSRKLLHSALTPPTEGRGGDAVPLETGRGGSRLARALARCARSARRRRLPSGSRCGTSGRAPGDRWRRWAPLGARVWRWPRLPGAGQGRAHGAGQPHVPSDVLDGSPGGSPGGGRLPGSPDPSPNPGRRPGGGGPGGV